MNTVTSPPIPPIETPAAPTRVWDAPVRVLHWLGALSFAGAWLTAEADPLRALHITLGLTLAGVMLLRVVWGLVGSRTARFSSFLKGPEAVAHHLSELVQGRVAPQAGHNPAGGWAVLVLIGLSLASAASGWFTWTMGERFEDLHEGLASVALAVVVLHVAAVALTSHLSRRNLVASMVHGRAPLPAAEGIARNHSVLAALLVAGVLAFWAWGLSPGSPLHAPGAGESEHAREHGGDDEDDDRPARAGAALPGASAAALRHHDDDDD